MGILKFQLPEVLPSGANAALRLLRFVGGYDRTPFPTGLRRDEDYLEVAHDLNESGYISVPWPIADFGYPATVTATLREQEGPPYLLLTELARGKLNQVRNTAEEWKHASMNIPVDVAQKMEKAMFAFGEAVVDPKSPMSFEKATESLRESYRAADGLLQLFLTSAAKVQHARLSKPQTHWTCQLQRVPTSDEAELYLAAFDTVQFVPNWSKIESAPSKFDWSVPDAVIDWATGQGTPVIIGPLIDLGSDSLPAWLNASDGDVPTLAAYLCDFVETIVQRYRDRVRDWVLCTGFNYGDVHNLTQDDRLRLVVRLLEAARAADGESRWTIGVNQPWGEYLDQPEQTLSPLVFCDTLLRTGLPIAGFSLEIRAETSSRGSQYRDGLEVIRLYELFGLLGVPIDITAGHPGKTSGSDVVPNTMNNFYRGSDTADAQAEWCGTLGAIAGTMTHIRSFAWNSWHDDAASAGGLIASDGQPKPSLFRLRHLRSGAAT
ncbi:hypothetical protein BH11PLA2_BH11PLA2_10590 [soil metagenome]